MSRRNWGRESTWCPRDEVEDFWEAWEGSRGIVGINLGLQDQESETNLTRSSQKNPCVHGVSIVSLKKTKEETMCAIRYYTMIGKAKIQVR
jgi:hypothetical protein